ncbi:MAG TPA: VOC family protein [Candidatus Dormibacteraeota bacterium]|nr:VOC family protein [Candidatus Dormibacteraeota bacterium]
MTQARTVQTDRPAWVDLSTPDPAAARAFYARLFGWDIEVNADPQYGGYGMARLGGDDVAGIGPSQSPDAPPVWNVYIGTTDAAGLAEQVTSAGGTVVAPAFDVGDVGRMAVFQDPTGAYISAWQPTTMPGFSGSGEGRYGWAELNSRGIDRAIEFYERVFGWTHRTTPMGDAGSYTEFLLDGESIAGGQEMNPMAPAEMPSYWMPYFMVRDVDAAYARAIEAGGREMVPPMDFPGGRFAILSDPQGAAFGLLVMPPA